MATTRKAARRSSARRAGGKLKRAPKRGTVRGRRAAKAHTKRGARRKPGTVSRPRPQPRRKPAPRQRKAVRRQKAQAMFGDQLLEAAETIVGPPPTGRSDDFRG